MPLPDSNILLKSYLFAFYAEAAEKVCNLGSSSSEGLAGSIDYIPLALNFSGFCHESGHNFYLRLNIFFDSALLLYQPSKGLSTPFLINFNLTFLFSCLLVFSRFFSRFLIYYFCKFYIKKEPLTLQQLFILCEYPKIAKNNKSQNNSVVTKCLEIFLFNISKQEFNCQNGHHKGRKHSHSKNYKLGPGKVKAEL